MPHPSEVAAYIGSGPTDEPCVQIGVGHPYQSLAQSIQLVVFMDQLKRLSPEAQREGVRLDILYNNHDSGTYGEVVAIATTPQALPQCYALEAQHPQAWDARAQTLRLYLALRVARHVLGNNQHCLNDAVLNQGVAQAPLNQTRAQLFDAEPTPGLWTLITTLLDSQGATIGQGVLS